MKKERKFSVGMFVRIPLNLEYTTKVYTSSSQMRELSGSIQQIKSITGDGDLLICGWTWDARDFQASKPPMKIPITHFDPNELVT